MAELAGLRYVSRSALSAMLTKLDKLGEDAGINSKSKQTISNAVAAYVLTPTIYGWLLAC